MKTYSLKSNDKSTVLPENRNKFLATRGNELWWQDEPNGWAAFTKREHLLSYQRAYGGEIIENNLAPSK